MQTDSHVCDRSSSYITRYYVSVRNLGIEVALLSRPWVT